MLLLAGLATLGFLTAAFVAFQTKLSELTRETDGDQVGSIMTATVQLDWGFAILVIAALFVIAAACVPRRTQGPPA